jgi:hypothetical protein
MVLTIYLLGVVISLYMLLRLWNKLETKLTLLSIICGLLSTLTSWVAVVMFTIVFIKNKTGNKKNDNIPII